MTLPAGARLGPYEVVAPLGAGGMGEVYRARDPRLGREVAIKVLLASFSSDPNRLRRSEQEARAASAEAEITRADFLPFEYDVWHDRAVFHFLTSAADRDAYVSSVLKAVKPGGHVIVCDVCGGWPGSLQPVMRYSADELHSEFGLCARGSGKGSTRNSERCRSTVRLLLLPEDRRVG